jgi:hypothetical protein
VLAGSLLWAALLAFAAATLCHVGGRDRATAVRAAAFGAVEAAAAVEPADPAVRALSQHLSQAARE